VGLVGRQAECAAIDQFLDAVRAGESRTLVVHGEPGAGKTALLDHLAGRASDCRVASTSGVQSEMELPLWGLSAYQDWPTSWPSTASKPSPRPDLAVP
jgi:hypothetical protein